MNINKLVGYLSIRHKLIIAFLAISFIPLIALGIYGLNIFSTGLSTMAVKHVEDEVLTIFIELLNSSWGGKHFRYYKVYRNST